MKRLVLLILLAPLAARASDLIADENRGVALMGKYDFDGAIDIFKKIVAEHPENARDVVNLAIATLNRQREGDSQAALTILENVLRDHPQEIEAHYCRGILLLNAGKPAEALSEFQRTMDADSRDPYAVYWIGQSLAALGRPAEALPMFQRAAELKSTLRSAYYGAFQTFQRLGRADEAKLQFAKFEALKDNPQAQIIEFKYTRMGPKAEASVSQPPSPTTAPQIPDGPAFGELQALKLTDAAGVHWNASVDAKHRPSITCADIDGDGKLDLVIAQTGLTIDGQPRNGVLLQRDNNRWELSRQHPLAKVEHVNAALWGDFDNDGLTDVYLCRSVGGNQLWRQTKPGVWEDVTAATATAGPGGDTIDGAFVDADHDGDLDLFLIRSDGTNVLLNNDGNGHFRDISTEAGIAGDGSGAVGLVVNDLDHDGDVDFIVLKKSLPHEVYLNDLRWHFAPGGDAWKGFTNSLAEAAVAADSDADGQVELYSVHPPNDVRRWTMTGDAWHSQPVNHTGAEVASPMAVADVKGIGQLSLLFRNAGDVEYSNLTDGTVSALRASSIQTFAPVVLDPKAGPSLVVIGENGAPLISPPGLGRLNFTAVTLSGKNRASDQMRSNACGIGVKIAARIADHWTTIDTFRTCSGAGQSNQPASIGLRGASAADFIRLTWPEGLQQTEMSLTQGAHKIEETQRQTSSCPVIFAWDGRHYAFVTDCLGVGGIGFAIDKDQFAPQRPRESVLLPSGLLKPRDGRYQIKLSEPMEEACYLDAASLVAYDLPPGWSMTVDERMATGDPEPTSEPLFFRRLVLPTHATNDRGQDVTESVRTVDQHAADPGEIDPRFIGHLAHEHVLTLTFDQPIDHPAALVADGWIEYPYSQTMFAAWQAGAKYEAATIEAQGADGIWIPILPQFGYPAGMPREMSVPLPMNNLPAGTRSLRIRTTMEIYWDRIAVAFIEPCPQVVKHVLPLMSASVANTGFAFRSNGPQRRPIYDYDRRAPLWDTHPQDGFYTRFGDAMDLIGDLDDAACIFGPGEEVHMEFAVGEGVLATGWSRHFALNLAGWCKDRDLYTKDGKSIEPLPRRDSTRRDSARDAIQSKFNTRWMSGN